MIELIYNGLLIPALKAMMPILKKRMAKLREREENYRDSLKPLLSLPEGKRVWFHAASMGEFEQAKPIIEAIKAKAPDTIIICSFYSPSGFNNQKNYKFADSVCYMPFDSKTLAQEFIDLVKPDFAVFIRYELWLNHLKILKKRSIPAILACATQPGSNFMMKPFLRAALNCFDKIYTVGEEHSDFFVTLNIKPEIVTLSDTRFDRIIASVESASKNPVLPSAIFDPDEKVLVAGSSWPPDEEIISEAVNSLRKNDSGRLKVIYVPHEPTNSHLIELESRLGLSVRLSALLALIEQGKLEEAKRELAEKDIIVDSIGKLLKLYGNADAAYIGGAFGVGVHSVTEPAGYGIPLATGPNMQNSYDAVNLEKLEALKIIRTAKDMEIWVKDFILDENKRIDTGRVSSAYINSGKGSSKNIAEYILSKI